MRREQAKAIGWVWLVALIFTSPAWMLTLAYVAGRVTA